MEESNTLLKDNGFSEEIQDHFSDLGKEIVVNKGEKILEQGQTCSFITIIISGLFKIYFEKDGNQSTIGLRYRGFVSDYSSFITGFPSEFSIMAFSDAKLIYFNKDDITSFFEYNIETQRFGRRIAEQLLVSTQKALISFLYDSAEERYSRIIKEHPELFQLFPLKDIANCIGVTSETLSRIRKRILHS